MALGKKVKVGGSFYKGHRLSVASSTGEYLLAIIPTTANFAVNGLSITPTSNGDGDYFGVTHVDTTATAGGNLISILATNMYNLGGGITIGLDFATLELVKPGESLRFSYYNTATQAMTVFVSVETIQ
jgi:hypothetical protein